MRLDKKQMELIPLRAFLKALGIDPIVKKRESPDFALTLGDRRIGLELVGYVRGQGPKGSSLRQQEQFQTSVVEDARRLYESEGGLPVTVSVWWHAQRATLGREQLARLIADVVRRTIPDPPAAGHISYLNATGLDLPDDLRPAVQRVRVLRRGRRPGSHQSTDSLWTSPQSGFISAYAEEIGACIASKDAKLKSYRERWDELWLLIHATDYYLSGTIDMLPDARDARYTTAFNRVYVLQSRHELVRLQVLPPIPPP